MWAIPSENVASSDYDREIFEASERVPFRLLDDDDNIIYRGEMTKSLLDSAEAFAPLDDYGTPDSGCTELRYKHHGRWEVL